MRALVLEGGAMRGIFTAGVLDAFHARDESFDLIIGASAGASNACSFLSNQLGRNKRIFIEHLASRDFIDPWRLLTFGSYADIGYLMGPVTLSLDPLDVPALQSTQTTLEVVATHATTGDAAYLPATEHDAITAIHASVAIPFFYRRAPIIFRGQPYFDGGVADPIPVQRAIDLGATDITVVLTRPPSWQPEALSPFARATLKLDLRHYPGTFDALIQRRDKYTATRNLIYHPPAEIDLTLITPPEDFPVTRFTKDRTALQIGYEQGFNSVQ